MSKKLPGWERELIGYISANGKASFRPGTMDCGLFFGGAVQVMTGDDINAPFRGKYRTIAAAIEIAEQLGFENHVEYVASLFPELASPLLAQRGDGAVLPDVEGLPALGVVQGENIYVLTLKGLSLVPLTTAIRAFRI